MTPQSTGSGASGETAREAASRWAVEYAEQPEPGFEPPEDGTVRVELLTDPWSIWCWGFEPVRRALELRYPSITFRPLLGGMFETLPDPDRQGFDIDRFFTTVQRTTGMPISTGGMEDDRPSSTYPACVHLHAIRLLEGAKARPALRRMREAAYLDGRNISDPDVAADVATEVGLEREAFRQALDSGEPEREFRHRLEALERQDLQAYPTLIVTSGETRTRIEGFQTLPSVLSIVESVSGRLHPSVPAPDLAKVLPEGERVATREVAEVLEVSIEQASEELQAAVEEGWVERERHATGDLWRRIPSPSSGG